MRQHIHSTFTCDSERNLNVYHGITLNQYLYNTPFLGSASTQAKRNGKTTIQIFQLNRHNICKRIKSMQNQTNRIVIIICDHFFYLLGTQENE
jgi:hypothetical protein